MPKKPFSLLQLTTTCIIILSFIKIYCLAIIVQHHDRAANIVDFPILQVGFCSQNDSTPDNCKPSYTSQSNSVLLFDYLRRGTFLRDETPKPMAASCISSEPLRWILEIDADVTAVPMETITSKPGAGGVMTYTYRIYFYKPISGLIRCESYENSSRAAQMYIAKEGNYLSYVYEDHLLLPFLVRQKSDAYLMVPCILKEFPYGKDYSNFKITQTSRQNILLDRITPTCLQCFPRPAVHFTTNCSSCNGFQLSWDDEEDEAQYGMMFNNASSNAQAELSSSSSHSPSSRNDLLRCVAKTDCYTKAATGKTFSTLPCNNPDFVVTCADAYSSIRDYPASCEAKDVLEQNFRAVEACMMKEMGKKLEGVDYDPRLGFLLKREPEHDNVVFKCPTAGRYWRSAYLTPYYYNGKLFYSSFDRCVLEVPRNESDEIPRPQLSYSYENSSTAEGGSKVRITCQIRESFKDHDKLDLVLIKCSTLTDCELKLRRERGYLMAPKSNSSFDQSTSIHFPGWFGRELIADKVSYGVVLCGFPYSPQPHGVNFDNTVGYVLTGLDSKPYFMIPDRLQEIEFHHEHALLRLKLGTGSRYGGVGSVATVVCTVSTFFLFPELQLTIESSQGRRPGGTLPVKTFGAITEEHKWSFDVPENFTKVHCTAPFRHSQKWLSVSLSEEEMLQMSGDSVFPYWIIMIVLGITLVILSAACVVWANVKYRRAKELRKLTKEEIDEFFHGSKKERVAETAGDGTIDADNIGFPAMFHVLAEDLKLDLSSKLGEGEFGCCVKGEYKGETVAVKSTKDTVEVAAFKDFLRELKIMAYIGSHENIVLFIGAQVNSIDQRICKAVLELSPYGDLLNYLRKRGGGFGNQNAVNNIANAREANLTYINVDGTRSESGGGESPLEFRHLCYFCQQIASGMEFLAEKRVIHGDLAARNVLVFPDFRVKVTDFGMSRKLYASANYTKKGTTPLPWRWMAIESLKYMEFSTMSDIWSFGVTAWEVFTWGQVPHSGMNWSHEFEEQLEHGMRLWRPEGLPEHVYQFMLSLWHIVPTARPSFSSAKQFFAAVDHGQEEEEGRMGGNYSNNIPA